MTDPTQRGPGGQRRAIDWTPGRASGLARLEAFVPQTGRAYARARNTDLGPADRSNVSGLSPYLRHRSILEEEVLRAVLERHGLSAAEKFVQEVFWRGYFKGWLEHRPQVWTRYRTQLRELLASLDYAGWRQRYFDAIQGRTGIDCFDAWVQELVSIGYLHNHARMWFASIWVFTLELPWQLGADFFYRHLLDGDPASNTLSWRWVCGLHTRGKTYLARAENISRYTNGRFDPAGRLAMEAPALVEPPQQDPTPLPSAHELDELGGAGRFGLLVTEEDSLPETLCLANRPVAAFGLVATDARSPLVIGAAARGFARGAVVDALERIARQCSIETVQCEAQDSIRRLADWARSRELDTVVTGYAPVGPVAERVAMAKRELGDLGIRLVQLRRRYDSATWPHATRGFFALKAKIPQILRTLNLPT